MITIYLKQVPEQSKILKFYVSNYKLNKLFYYKRQLKIDNFNLIKKCEELAEKTEKFSGREISKLIVSCQAGAYASDDGKLTEKMVDDKLKLALLAHEKKMKWRSEGEQQ